MTNQLEFDKAVVEDFSAWVRWSEADIEIEIKNLSVPGAERLLKECQKIEWDSKTHQRTEKIDDEKFKRKVADLILGWKGFTAAKAGKFVRLQPGTNPSDEFPCTARNKLYAIASFPGFPTFILDTAKQLHQMAEERQEAEEKN